MGKFKIQINEHHDIIEQYQNGKKVADIAKQYDVSSATIFHILNKHNVPKRTNSFHEMYNDEIIRLYELGSSVNKIALLYGVDKNTISAIVNKYSSIRPKSESHRKYKLNEFYFDKIDTPNKAYILGLLYADGTNDGVGHVALSLQEKDVDVLQKIQKEINSNAPLNYRNFKQINENWNNQWRMFIHNKHISETLARHGVVKNKTLIIEYPKWLNAELNSHFIRGMIDGDGHISQKYISLVGTYDICFNIGEILKESCGVNYIIYKHGNMYDLRINRKKDRIDVLQYLYKDAVLYLDRKYHEYLNFINDIDNSNKSNELVG